MELIADFLMIAGTFGAAIYCYVLAARLKQFSTLETGMGGAIAVLSAQVDDMTKALEKAGNVAIISADSLDRLTARAEVAAKKLELLLASLHDLPEASGVNLADDEMSAGDRKPRLVRRRTARNEMEAAQ